MAMRLPGNYGDAMRRIAGRLATYDIAGLNVSGDCVDCHVEAVLIPKDMDLDEKAKAMIAGLKAQNMRLAGQAENATCLYEGQKAQNAVLYKRIKKLRDQNRALMTYKSKRNFRIEVEPPEHFTQAEKEQFAADLDAINEVRLLMKETGVTQKEVGQRLGVAQSTVNRILHKEPVGIEFPDYDVLKTIVEEIAEEKAKKQG